MQKLTIQLLNNFRVHNDQGEELVISSRKARAMLAYLLVKAGKPVSRLQLASLLWEHHDEQQALTNLRQSLSVLNKVLGSVCEDWLNKKSGSLAIRPEYFKVDIHSLEQPDSQLRPDFYGEFFAGARFHEDGLNEWISNQRRHYYQKQADALRQGLVQFRQAGDHSKILEIAQQLVLLDPIDEESHRHIMSAYSALGQQHRVLRQYQQCCQALEACQLGEPQQQTTELFESLYHQTRIQPVFETEMPEPGISREATDDIPFIAVLPFREQGLEQSASTLASALTEEIVTELRRFQGFRVISALSSLSLQGGIFSLSTAASELRARYLVSGSIRQHNRHRQVMVELVDSSTGELIWAEKYMREHGDLFAMNAELAKDIAGAVEPETAGHAFLLSKRKSPESITAWDLVLQGDHELYLQMGTQWSSQKARALYEQAVKLEPDYAPAYAGYAYSLCLDLKEDICPDRNAVIRRMQEMAELGVSLDANNPFCHVVMGRVYHQQEDYQAALINYRKAVELCPSSAKAHFGLGFGLAATGKYDEAIAAVSRAQALSPRDPFSWVFHTVKALSHMYAERFDAAEDSAGISSAYPKANHWASLVHASSLVHTGRFDDALNILQKVRGKRPDITAHSVTNAFPVANDVDPRSITEGLVEAGLPKG